MLAAIVVFCTTYALILPAITMETTYFCGKEEHTHTDDCYGYITCETLICDAGLHSHDGECLDENGYVACGKADYFVHSHNSYCYNNDGKLICALKEVTEHVHTDSCYEALSVPVTEAVIPEETVPENFRTNGDTYTVTVSYDELVITVTHPDGTSEPWINNTAVIENIPIYIPESQSLLITKDVNSLNGGEISDLLLDSARFTFRVMASDAEGNAYDTFFLLPGTPYSIIQSGNTVGTGIVASDGTFTLKAGQTVLFTDLLTIGNGDYYVVEELISDKESGSIATVRYTVKAEEKTPGSSKDGVYTAYTTEAFDKHNTESLGSETPLILKNSAASR